MTSMTALRVAREQLRRHRSHRAVFAERPRSQRFHIYVGRLTRSRRHVPRAGRPVCGARTGRLQVCWGPVAPGLREGAALCRRCERTCARLVPETPVMAGGPMPLDALTWSAIAITAHTEIHAVQAACMTSGVRRAAHAVAHPLHLARVRYPDLSCCPTPPEPGDLSLDWSKHQRAYDADRATRRRLGQSIR